MSAVRHEVRRGIYYDSVILMQLQRSLSQQEGVEEAGVVMATEANRKLLEARDLLPELDEASDQDLLIVIKGEDDGAAQSALAAVDELLSRKSRAGQTQGFRPRTLEGAVEQLPAAQWVLISVPGRYAAAVAREAVALDRHVFLFSDNVPLEDEVDLKAQGADRGRLVMGPDCGTALIGGAGFGFANRVRRGKVGIVSASGTGLQAVSSHIHELGGGISHAIGTGGRDLKEAVGAATTRQGLDLLARDEGTGAVVLISKPPSPAVVPRVLAAARAVAKPVVVAFQGWPAPAPRLGNLHFARDFAEAAQLAVELVDRAPGVDNVVYSRVREGGEIRGLFSGGTLAGQFYGGLKPLVPNLRSNVAPDEKDQPEDVFQPSGPIVLDLGEDEFTEGRLHPMMDNELRLERMAREAKEAATGLVVLDVVLGEGAHPDPADELGPRIRTLIEQEDVEFAVVLVGTDEDGQDVEKQQAVLAEAGAKVYRDVGSLLNDVVNSLPLEAGELGRPVPLEDFAAGPVAINIGLGLFEESLEEQGEQVLGLDWRPPAQGDEEMMDLLARMKE